MPKFRITGYAFVPVKVEIEAVGATAQIAGKTAELLWAKRSTGMSYIVPGTEDHGAAHSFKWSEAEPIKEI